MVPDRENVIKTLEQNVQLISNDPACVDWGNVEMAMRDALELLREDPADAVREGLHFVCGNCLKMLPPLSVYCPQCGRRLRYD